MGSIWSVFARVAIKRNVV